MEWYKCQHNAKNKEYSNILKAKLEKKPAALINFNCFDHQSSVYLKSIAGVHLIKSEDNRNVIVAL